MPRILVIDDNETVCQALDVLFSIHNMETLSAYTPQDGLRFLQENPVDLVIQDMNFSEDTTSGEEGKKLFSDIRAVDPDMPIILLTAWGDLEMAVELVRSGAADYLTKPWDDDKLVITISNLLDLKESSERSLKESRKLRSQAAKLEESFDLCGFIYASTEMHNLLRMATQVAASNLPVLITGPSGTGKSKLAEVIQRNSIVKDGPFISVNAGALPSELIEAELFGNEAGAYTGATKSREGRFEAADKGTLFLDEIGTLPANGQVKLLRILESGEFEKLGSSKTRKVDVRIISATNADLKQAIRDNTFREDLFYRLNVIELRMPALSERPDDILPLAYHFLEDGYALTDDACRALCNYSWPGNIRELQNALQRAMLICSDKQVTASDLNLPVEARSQSTNSLHPVDITADEITELLSQYRNNISQVAKQLGLSRQALYRRMDKLGIER